MQQGPIGHLLDQGMPERMKSLVVGRQVVKQFRLPELPDGFGQFVLRQGGDAIED